MAQGPTKIVVPIIAVGSVENVQLFYVASLGFTRVMGVMAADGRLDMAAFALDGARLTFRRDGSESAASESPAPARSVEIYLEVADIDAYHATLSRRNVAISDPLTLQWWGDKTFKLADPNGYTIWFYEKVGQPKPPQGVTLV